MSSVTKSNIVNVSLAHYFYWQISQGMHSVSYFENCDVGGEKDLSGAINIALEAVKLNGKSEATAGRYFNALFRKFG